ncbi:charged multivesicular body protein 3 [Neodiprion pinetum]|uniref:Charged multivesicular body protein 3 n=1 Tax=Neodiprion lecontei TaxID=441921 RepID=A0A6J0BJM1_NEOLC|nr:charged multivesicular body protein 3 [Neodiprion lecontei]XP_046472064.1 charged multivesicular body protein 3 [Neodiprion pinetum]XP_046610719.1 charged multivesicular body protein 3 [Neodiprion virginianus]
MGLFGKSHEQNPKEMVQEWTHKLRKEGYQLDRQVRAIQREEEKVKRSLKEAAKKGDKDVCTILAKEVIRARKACNKIYTSKAHLNSVSLQMKNQLATIRVAGSLSKSTEVMQAMQSLIKVPEVAATMREMSKEMMKAGIIEEMLDETMDSVEDSEEMEDEAQEEVDKVLWELTAGQLGTAPAVVTETPGVQPVAASSSKEEEVEDVDDTELEEMKNRLQSLRS